MKHMRRGLSWLLVLCMLLSMLSLSAFAEEETDAAPAEEAAEAYAPEAESAAEAEETADLAEEADIEEIVEPMLASATQPTAPDDGTVSGCPFVKGTAGSNSFRIPSMVTLSDGTLVAAADARWNTTYDGGCGDTIVARSSDSGSTWSYTFANYLGDNGNTYNASSSTCFIDPALAVDSNDKIYMLVDLYPYGVALNGADGKTDPSTASGFNSDGTLKLSKDGSNYNYYLKDGKIYNSSNTAESGYTVDGKFNISYNGSYVSNLFFSDSPYKVVRTGYLYLTTSTTKGATWSDPILLPNIKTTSEQVCLVGPGRGNVLSDGTIVFPVYSYNGSSSSQRCGFIYSTDNGDTWSRSNSTINWSSEAAIVEVNSSTLRVFYRNGNSRICYVDVTKSGNSYTWGSAVTTSVACNSNTQLSAIKVTSGGTDYILVSNPGNESNDSSATARTKGQIVTFKASDMSVVKTTSVPSVHTTNSFMYSCMSQLSNGNVAILYEDQQNDWGTGSNCYYQMSFKTYALSDLGISTTTGSDTITDSTNTATVTSGDGTYLTSITCTQNTSVSGITTGTDYVAYDITLNEGKYTSAGTVTLPLSDTLKAATNLTGFVVNTDGSITKVTGKKSDDGSTYTFTSPHFSTVGVMAVDSVAGDTVDVTLTVGQTSDVYTVSSDTNYGTTSATTTDGIAAYVQTGTDKADDTLVLTEATSLAAGYIGDGTNFIVFDPSGSYASDRLTTTTDISKATKWTTSGGNGSTIYYTYNNTKYYFVICSSSGSATDWSYVGAMTQSEISACSNGQNATGWSFDSTKKLNAWGQSKCVAYDSSTGKWLHKQNSTTAATIYTSYSGTTGTPASTTIQFTGASAGTTSVTVGDTTYNITVTPKEIAETKYLTYSNSLTLNPTVPTGGSVTYSVTSGSCISLSGATVTAGSTAGSATVVATVRAANGNTYATYTYTINVSDIQTVTADLTVAQMSEEEITVTLADGQYVEWTSADSSIASVGAEYSGEDATNKAMVMGNAAGTTTITGTVKNSDGSVAAIYTWNTTVTAASDSNTSTRHIYVKVKQIENCTVYYSINGGELIKLDQPDDDGYVQIDSDITGHFNIMFFAAPDDGYALTYMGVSGSDNQYYTLTNGNPDGTGSDAWPFTSATQTTIPSGTGENLGWKTINSSLHGFRWPLYEGNLSINRMKAMFSQAIALGCDGVTSFTKNGTDSYYTEVQFVASPLPTVEKTIKSITHNGTTKTYAAGDKIALGDTITYTVTVTEPAYLTGDVYQRTYNTQTKTYAQTYTVTSPITDSNKPTYATESLGTITYSNVSLTDALTGSNGITTPSMGTSTADDQSFSYDTSVTLTMANFDQVVNGVLTNTAELGYAYKSSYSSGTISETADAKAEAEVEVPEYVIDFGLPVTIDVGSTVLGGTTISSATATYGDVAVNGTSFTYTPNQVLKSTDYVALKLENGQSYGVRIYPATTVYYEEGFATYTGSWTSTGSKGSGTQATTVAGSNTANYGYDTAYNASGASNGTQATSATLGDEAIFSFTGTGVEIYANTDTSTGWVYIQVKDASGMPVSTTIMNTAMVSGGTDATADQAVTGYNVPVTTVRGLDYGTYTVYVYHIAYRNQGRGLDVNLDGFRVFGTLADEATNTVYHDDLEEDPSYVEMRSEVLYSIGASTTTDLTDQVNAALTDSSDTRAIIVTNTTGTDYTKDNLTDLLNNGPKNELYLYPNQTLVFSVDTAKTVQIGMKALNATPVTYTVNNGTAKTLSSDVDMFYPLQSAGTSKTTYTIKNTGSSGILSITLLKVSDDPEFALAALTADDILQAICQHIYYYSDNGDGTHTAVCGVCGKTFTEEHNYVDGVCTCGADDGSVRIVTQPEGGIATYGETVKLTVEAVHAKSYQWYYSKDGGQSWKKLYWEGAKTDTLSVAYKASRADFQYQCLVKGTDGTEISTEPTSITQGIAPIVVITEQPESVTAMTGDTVSFSIAAENAVTYQWFYSSDNGTTWNKLYWDGAKTDTLTFEVTKSRYSYVFYCKLTDGNGLSYYSHRCYVSLPFALNAQPQDVTAAYGDTVSLTVSAEGVQSYQWYYSKDGGESWGKLFWDGAKSDTMSFTFTEARADYVYYCKLTAYDGTETATNIVKVTAAE